MEQNGSLIVSRWRSIRSVYPIYTAIAAKFSVGPPPPFANLHQVADESEPSIIAKVEAWLAAMDDAVQPHQFRHVLQQTNIAGSEEKLQALVQRHLDKPTRTDADRDKLSVLLAQYLWVCAPPSFRTREITLEEAGAVLEPLLGEPSLHLPDWLRDLEAAVADMRACESVADLHARNILQRGRDLKAIAGPRYFVPSSLVAFTFFSYCVRRTFVRVMLADARATEAGIQQLQAHGITHVEYLAAGSLVRITLGELHQRIQYLCHRVAGDYNGDDTWKLVQTLREAVDTALDRTRSSFTPADEQRISYLESQIREMRAFLEQLRAEQPPPPLPGEPSLPHPEPSHDDSILDLADAAEPAAASPPPQPPVAAPPPVAAAPPSNPPPAQLTPETYRVIHAALDNIRRALRDARGGLITIDSATLLLSSSEIEAVHSDDDELHTLRVSVALRMLMIGCLQKRDLASIPSLTSAARHVLAEAATQKDSPIAGPLAASCRQLTTLLRQLEQLRARESMAG